MKLITNQELITIDEGARLTFNNNVTLKLVGAARLMHVSGTLQKSFPENIGDSLQAETLIITDATGKTIRYDNILIKHNNTPLDLIYPIVFEAYDLEIIGNISSFDMLTHQTE